MANETAFLNRMKKKKQMQKMRCRRRRRHQHPKFLKRANIKAIWQNNSLYYQNIHRRTAWSRIWKFNIYLCSVDVRLCTTRYSYFDNWKHNLEHIEECKFWRMHRAGLESSVTHKIYLGDLNAGTLHETIVCWCNVRTLQMSSMACRACLTRSFPKALLTMRYPCFA